MRRPDEEMAYVWACDQCGASRKLESEEDRKKLFLLLLDDYASGKLDEMLTDAEIEAAQPDESTKEEDIVYDVDEKRSIDVSKVVEDGYKTPKDFMSSVDFNWYRDEHEDELEDYFYDELMDEPEAEQWDYDEDAYEDHQYGLDSKVKDEPEHLTWEQLKEKIAEHNKEAREKAGGFLGQYQDPDPLHCVVVFSEVNAENGNWKPADYPLESRSYEFRSDDKYFLPDMGGSSIFASSLDGTDNIRMDKYLFWDIDHCYIK